MCRTESAKKAWATRRNTNPSTRQPLPSAEDSDLNIYTLSANGFCLGRSPLSVEQAAHLNSHLTARHQPYRWAAL